MVSVKESEQLGNALNMLEALNNMILTISRKNRFVRKYFIYGKIEKVIAFIDNVVA